MVAYCCVLGCKLHAGQGVKMHRFPRDEQICLQWIQALTSSHNPKLAGKERSAIRRSYFVCHKHFAPEALIEIGRRGSNLKFTAVPTLYLNGTEGSSATVPAAMQVDEMLEPVDTLLYTPGPSGASISTSPVPVNEMTTREEYICLPSTSKDDVAIYRTGFKPKDDKVTETTSSTEVHLDISHNGETDNVNNIAVLTEAECVNTCRFCLKEVTDAYNIFEDYINPNLPIYLAMKVCLYPIKVSSDDLLSKYACSECLNTLSNFVEFRALVLRNDIIMRKRLDKSIPSVSKTKPVQKQYTETENEPHLSKKIKIVHIPEQTKIKDISKQPDFLHSDGLQEKWSISKENFDSGQQVQKIQLDDLESSTTHILHSSTLVDTSEKVTNNRKQDGGNMTMIREENFQQTDSNLKVSNDSQTTYDNLFCMANEYLMEHKILKGNLRYLKCVLAKCPAVGTQEVSIPGIFKKTISITKPHNHKKPTEIDVKKQKFISVIRKRLQSLKGSSIKTIYDEVCKLDPDLAQLVPMKELMNEICNL